MFDRMTPNLDQNGCIAEEIPKWELEVDKKSPRNTLIHPTKAGMRIRYNEVGCITTTVVLVDRKESHGHTAPHNEG